MSVSRAFHSNVIPFTPRVLRRNAPVPSVAKVNRYEDPILLKILATPVNASGILSHLFVDWETQVLQDAALDGDLD